MQSILDPAFRYVPSFATSVAATWRRFGWRPTTDEDRKARCRPDIELVVRVSAMRERDDIGVRETLDVGGVFVDSRKPKRQMPASNPRINVNITALSHAA